MEDRRFDLYSLVHKGQRQRMFELTVRAGRVAPNEELGALAADVAAFVDTLTEHAESEDGFIAPLLAACAPDVAQRLHDAHAHIERLSAEVLAASHGPALYRALCRLSMAYLGHLDDEEHLAQPALWAAYDDARLGATQAEIVAAHRPATVAYNLACMLPAATRGERVGFLSGLKRRLPPPAFAGMRANIASLVPDEEWAQIDAA